MLRIVLDAIPKKNEVFIYLCVDVVEVCLCVFKMRCCAADLPVLFPHTTNTTLHAMRLLFYAEDSVRCDPQKERGVYLLVR